MGPHFYVVYVNRAISKLNVLFEAKNTNSVETGEMFFDGSLIDY